MQVRNNSNTNFGNPYPLVFDLDRVEILRGPQGTLFGAGSEAGTVRFITPQPSLTNYSLYSRAESSYTVDGEPSYEAGAAIGGPIVQDKLGFRVSAWIRRDGGWVDRQDYETGVREPNANWANNAVFRGALTFAPVDAVLITSSLYYQDVHTADTSQYWEPLSNPSAGRFVNGNVLADPSSDRFYLPTLKIEAQLPWARLESISSYFYRSGFGVTDATTFESEVWSGTPYPTLPGQNAPQFSSEVQNITTQEIRLSSLASSSPINWVAGLIYSDARQEDEEIVEDQFLPQLIYNAYGLTMMQFFGEDLLDGKYTLLSTDASKEKQAAAYGHVNIQLPHELTLGLGLRVARTELDYFEFDGGPVEAPTHSFSGSQKGTPVTPQASLQYRASPTDMVYATVAKGYRLGGINGPIPSSPPCAASLAQLGLTGPPPSYDSDNLWNYEIGTKDKVFDNRLVLDLSIFHDVWKNIQEEVLLPACGYAGFTSNLGSATSDGFDLALQANLGGGFRTALSLGYTHATYSQTIGPSDGIIVSKGDTLPNTTPWSVTFIRSTTSKRSGAKMRMCGCKTYITVTTMAPSRDRIQTPSHTIPRSPCHPRTTCSTFGQD